ncbi:MAG: sulfite exporter TauE/SafE family protein [Isosphaeraceae bacterium]
MGNTSYLSEILPFVLLGLAAGVLSGMFGIGGGLVIVPALMILFRVPLETATGTSLFALLWPVGALGVLEYWRKGHVNAWQGALIAIGLFFGAYSGARIALALPKSTMKQLYGTFLILVGIYYFWANRTDARSARAQEPQPPTSVPGPSGDQVH